ncbi:MAG: hypothetical protein KTR31_05555 [Myxococcales bacterium]|nr:hypothetical protein [Myxococcales bacterium]
MGCERATSDTLLWVYGEGSDDVIEHIASCAECQAVVDEHAYVVSALGPALAGTAPATLEPATTPRPRRRWGAVVAPLSLAAVALLAVLVLAPDDEGGSGLAMEPAPSQGTSVALGADPLMAPLDALDLAMDDLDRELDELSRDLEML